MLSRSDQVALSASTSVWCMGAAARGKAWHSFSNCVLNADPSRRDWRQRGAKLGQTLTTKVRLTYRRI